VVEAGSFGKAAKQLNRSRSSLSYVIARPCRRGHGRPVDADHGRSAAKSLRRRAGARRESTWLNIVRIIQA
jgi:hypothetical protein